MQKDSNFFKIGKELLKTHKTYLHLLGGPIFLKRLNLIVKRCKASQWVNQAFVCTMLIMYRTMYFPLRHFFAQHKSCWHRIFKKGHHTHICKTFCRQWMSIFLNKEFWEVIIFLSIFWKHFSFNRKKVEMSWELKNIGIRCR